jgi:hypothetical protein
VERAGTNLGLVLILNGSVNSITFNTPHIQSLFFSL